MTHSPLEDMKLSFETEVGFFKQVTNYEDYKDCLSSLTKACKTREQLDIANSVIKEVKTRLIETSPEFHSIMGQHKLAAKMESEQRQALHRAKMAETKAEASRIRNKALSEVKDHNVENWVSQTRIKTYDPNEKQKEIDAGLWCPICRKEDKRKNIVNGKPMCTDCWHGLVPKEKLKDYPRKYRRSWKAK